MVTAPPWLCWSLSIAPEDHESALPYLAYSKDRANLKSHTSTLDTAHGWVWHSIQSCTLLRPRQAHDPRLLAYHNDNATVSKAETHSDTDTVVRLWRFNPKPVLQVPDEGFDRMAVLLMGAIDGAVDIPGVPASLKEA